NLMSGGAEWINAAAQVERRDRRWGQRLITVTSQWLEPPQQRGSVQILSKLTDDVVSEVSGNDPARLVQTRGAVRPWMLTAGLLALILGLTLVPWLSLSTLLLRQIAPLAAIGPVTTTVLSIEPGDADIIQGDSLRISARP